MTNWNIEELTGYKPISTFYEDLGIAEHFGYKAVEDTYRDIVKHWGKDYMMFTEFVMALNWKAWEWDARENDDFVSLYTTLYFKGDKYAREHFNDKELAYYYRTTD